MKAKEELNALKEEVEALNKKLHELTDEELEQVVGGAPNGKFDGNISKEAMATDGRHVIRIVIAGEIKN